jgi:hypothetical protein
MSTPVKVVPPGTKTLNITKGFDVAVGKCQTGKSSLDYRIIQVRVLLITGSYR